jgi:hypothetical protein
LWVYEEVILPLIFCSTQVVWKHVTSSIVKQPPVGSPLSNPHTSSII